MLVVVGVHASLCDLDVAIVSSFCKTVMPQVFDSDDSVSLAHLTASGRHFWCSTGFERRPKNLRAVVSPLRDARWTCDPLKFN